MGVGDGVGSGVWLMLASLAQVLRKSGGRHEGFLASPGYIWD